MKDFSLTANLVNIFSEEIRSATLVIKDGRVHDIRLLSGEIRPGDPFILPGFIDAHVHVESSMLVPSEFARLAVVHGTVATVSDPHEIANVLGVDGVTFMLENAKQVPFRFFFGAPSCVPATPFETAGAALDSAAVEKLLERDDIHYLSEMMNFPGVLHGDPEVMKKIAAAEKHHKPIDGHAPGLRGEAARQYAEAGTPGRRTITTDHECFTREEALDKLAAGMKIIIREGSAARNFEALWSLLREFPDRMMFCSDDKHPDSLVEGHINLLVKRGLEKGVPLFNLLQAACINPVLHYGLPVGLLRKGDPADFILVRDLASLDVLETYVQGVLVAEGGTTRIASVPVEPLNQFACREKKPGDFIIASAGVPEKILVMRALDGELITEKEEAVAPIKEKALLTDPENDLLKIAVVNRYSDALPARAFVRGFGIREGAIASSVAHDSHNIIAVGTDDDYLSQAVNLLVRERGGISLVYAGGHLVLPLPIAGLMSGADGYQVASRYAAMDHRVKGMGSRLRAPFMTLSFMALLVIPHLKLSDRGLFDGDLFAFASGADGA